MKGKWYGLSPLHANDFSSKSWCYHCNIPVHILRIFCHSLSAVLWLKTNAVMRKELPCMLGFQVALGSWGPQQISFAECSSEQHFWLEACQPLSLHLQQSDLLRCDSSSRLRVLVFVAPLLILSNPVPNFPFAAIVRNPTFIVNVSAHIWGTFWTFWTFMSRTWDILPLSAVSTDQPSKDYWCNENQWQTCPW